MIDFLLWGGGGNILTDSYFQIIAASAIIIFSFFFGEISKKTNVPSVLMLIVLGIILKMGLDAYMGGLDDLEKELDLKNVLPVLGTVGLIMIVLEAALELELKQEKIIPIAKAFIIALIGLLASIWAAAEILKYALELDTLTAWFYATPLSILSSAIIIPSVTGLNEAKKEFHIYESTFSDILGIMVFIYLSSMVGEHGGGGFGEFGINVVLTIVLSVIASYLIIFVFQNIKSHAKLFLLIAVLLFLYAAGKKVDLSSLLIILIFGLIIANKELFFKGILNKWLNIKEVDHMYEGLHTITLETAFVVRTFFFVIFGTTIALSSLANFEVAKVSLMILATIFIIRFVLIRLFIGKDILPQLYIAPRGLITVLLYYKIPDEVKVGKEIFDPGILFFIIIATSLIMTFAMIADKRRTGKAVQKANSNPIGFEPWEAPTIEAVSENSGELGEGSGHH